MEEPSQKKWKKAGFSVKGVMIEQHIGNQGCPEKTQAVTPIFTREKLKLEGPGLGGDSSLDLELPVYFRLHLLWPHSTSFYHHTSVTLLLSISSH